MLDTYTIRVHSLRYYNTVAKRMAVKCDIAVLCMVFFY